MCVSYLQGEIEICTPSDKAFALVLALENSYDLWIDIADKLIMANELPRKTQANKGKTCHAVYESDNPTKCTRPPAKPGTRRKIGSEQKEVNPKLIPSLI